MLREFVRDSVVYGIAAILSRAVSLLLVPLLTRHLAPGAYGAIDILTLIGSLVALSIALEISQALPRFFTDATTHAERVAYASTALWFTVAVYVALCSIAFLSARTLAGLILQSPDYASLFRVAVVMYATTGLFYFVQGQLRWERRARQYAIASVVSAVVSLASVSWLLLVMKMGAPSVFIGQSIGNIVGAALGLYFAHRSFARVFDRRRCLEMLKFSAPLVPSGLAVFVSLYSDRLIVQRILSLSEVGKLSAGYRVASVVGLIVVGFQSALTPIVFARFREPGTPGQIARIFAVFCAFALLICTALGMFAREIMMILTSPRYYSAASVVPLLAPAVLLSAMYVFAPGLVIAKRTGGVALLNFGGAALNVSLNLLLVPVFGINGAALATLTSAALTFGGYMLTSQRLYPVPHQWARLGAGVGVSTIGGVAGFLVGDPSAGTFAIRILLFTGVALVILKLELVKRSEIHSALAILKGRLNGRGSPPLPSAAAGDTSLALIRGDIDVIERRTDPDV